MTEFFWKVNSTVTCLDEGELECSAVLPSPAEESRLSVAALAQGKAIAIQKNAEQAEETDCAQLFSHLTVGLRCLSCRGVPLPAALVRTAGIHFSS